jgi:hypothetical protein
MQIFVMRAWIAGTQIRRIRPETSMSIWIPALHAGMTESRSRTKTDRGPPPLVFSKEITNVTKDWIEFLLLSFACFVVKSVAQCRTAPRPGSLSSILGGCVAALSLWTGEENSRYIFPHLAALGGREQRAVAAFSSASFHDLDQ